MKSSKLILVILASLVSSLALAELTVKTDAERERANLKARGNYPVIKYQGSKSRAEVHAELEAARSAPPSMPGKAAPVPAAPQPKVLEPSGKPGPDLYRGA